MILRNSTIFVWNSKAMSETITDFDIHQNNHSDFMAWIDSFDNFFSNSSNNLFIQLFVSHPVINSHVCLNILS